MLDIELMFNNLLSISEMPQPQNAEMRALFETVVFEWEKVSDIDFSLISVEVIQELMNNIDAFINEPQEHDELINRHYREFLSANRTIGKKRILL